MRSQITYTVALKSEYKNLGLSALPPGKVRSDSIVDCTKELDDPEVEFIFRSTYPGQANVLPYWVGWHSIDYEYSESELQAGKIFHVRFRRSFHAFDDGELTDYDLSEACPFCGLGRKQLTPLVMPGRWSLGTPLAISAAGTIICRRDLAQKWTDSALKGVLLLPIYKAKKKALPLVDLIGRADLDDSFVMSQGIDLNRRLLQAETEAFQVLVTGRVDIDSSTKAGVAPYVDCPDKAVCPLGHVIGGELLSPLHIRLTEINDDRDFWLTRQGVGGKGGLYLPHRELVVSRKVYEASKEFKNKWAPIDPILD